MKYSLDLHLHTKHSDGSYDYPDLFDTLKYEGIEAVSVTDHDSIGDIRGIKKFADDYSISFVPGVEISSFFSGGEVHVLGYGYDYNDSGFIEFVNERFNSRVSRIKKTIVKLNERGIDINFDEVSSQSPGPYVGRPNVAKVLFYKGYTGSYEDAFSNEFIGNDAYAYVPPDKCDTIKAIEKIILAGGCPVLAHPGIYKSNKSFLKGFSFEQIKYLKENGLEGIEVFHPKHSYVITKRYYDIARKLDLKITLGSDFHSGNYVPIYKKAPENVLKEVFEWLSESGIFL